MVLPAKDSQEHPDLRAAREAVRAARERDVPPPSYLDFRLAILEISRGGSAETRGAPLMPAVPSGAESERRLREGIPLFDASGTHERAFPEALANIARVMKTFGIEGGATLAGALGKGRKDHPDLESMARAVLTRDTQALGDAAGKIGISASLLRFAVSAALYPDLRPAAEAVAPLLRNDLWMRGYCPACGAEPGFGTLRREPEGARMLHCSVCGTSWRFKRIACPFCGNETHGDMEVLLVDSRPQLRVSACRACRRYLKETDERKLAEGTSTCPAAEDIVSLDLDMEAEKRGYAN
jgi:FdhE protein